MVAAAAEVGRYDVADVAVRAQGGANPVIPLLADLRSQVAALDTAGIGAGTAVHTSLTSQDVLDSALMLLCRGAVRGLLAELTATTAALAALAEQHTDTLCVGRSLTQHSLPFSFGLKAAQWFHGLAAAARRLEALEFPVQTGGAAGTLAAGTVLTSGSGLSPLDLSDRLAAELGLAAVPAPWHTNRLAVTSLGDALAAVTDAAGKIAADVLFLSRPEVAELAEPRAAGRGGSSAMPQKQNPVLSVLVRSAALQAPGHAAQLHLAAANFNDERPDGAWHSEWPALRQLLRLGLGAAVQLRELAEGLQVFPRPCGGTWNCPARCCSAKPSRPPSRLLLAGNVAGKSTRGRQAAAAGRGGPGTPGPGRGPGAHLPAAAPRGRPAGTALRCPAGGAARSGQLPRPGRRNLPAHPRRLPGVRRHRHSRRFPPRTIDPRTERSLPWLDQQSRQYC